MLKFGMAECLLAVKSVLNDCVSIKELQRAVSCREWGKCRAAVGEGSPVGGIVTV